MSMVRTATMNMAARNRFSIFDSRFSIGSRSAAPRQIESILEIENRESKIENPRLQP